MADQVKPQQSGPDFSFERKAQDALGDLFSPRSPKLVLGVDEAGRGPWAGPVTAAAAWINPDAIGDLPKGLNDSKTLSRAKRTHLFSALKELAEDKSIFRYAVVSISAEVIDEIGILPATFRAMDKAVLEIISAAIIADDQAHILVDGNLAPSFDQTRQFLNHALPITPIIKGDQKSLSIAAASIMAKETRDLEMETLDALHPGYGWGKNMGYGTKDHQEALAKQGPTPHHRFSYKPIAKIASQFNATR